MDGHREMDRHKETDLLDIERKRNDNMGKVCEERDKEKRKLDMQSERIRENRKRKRKKERKRRENERDREKEHEKSERKKEGKDIIGMGIRERKHTST